MSAPTDHQVLMSLDAFRAIGKLMDAGSRWELTRGTFPITSAEWAAARDLLVRYQRAEVEALRVEALRTAALIEAQVAS